MKTAKKSLAILLAVIMVLALGATAFAQTVDAQYPTPNGSLSITSPKQGAKYTLYKIFDATVDGTAVAYKLTASGLGSSGTTWFETPNGTTAGSDVKLKSGVTLDDSVMSGTAFQSWVASYGTAANKIAEATSDGTTLVFQNLPLGYYFVESSLRTATTNDEPRVMAVSVTPTGTIYEKNKTPGWDNGPGDPGKVIIENGQKVSVNEAALGENISFDIGVATTNYDHADKILVYYVEDKIDEGMTYTEAPTLSRVNGSTTTNLGSSAYSVTWYPNNDWTGTPTTMALAKSFRVRVPWTNGAAATGDFLYPDETELHVSYKAMLDPAKGDKVKYTSANENVAKFKWIAGSKPDDPTDPSGTSPEKKTETFETQLVITKTDGTNTLTGAEFTLTGTSSTIIYTQGYRYAVDNTNGNYWLLKDGTYTTTDPATQGVNQAAYQDVNTKYKLESFAEAQGKDQTETNIKAYVGNDGKLTFSGLGAGSYKLSETKVPAGYNKIQDIEFTVTFDATSKTFSATVTSPTGTGAPRIELNTANNNLATSIVNQAGSVLPSTGGVGTTIFYVLGSCLLLGAAVLMITRKRMGRES